MTRLITRFVPVKIDVLVLVCTVIKCLMSTFIPLTVISLLEVRFYQGGIVQGGASPIKIDGQEDCETKI